MASAKLITPEVVRHTPWPMLGFVHELTVENRKLRLEIEALQAKLNQNSANSNKPPSSDSPFKPRAKKTNKTEPRKKGNRQKNPFLRLLNFLAWSVPRRGDHGSIRTGA